MRAGSIRLSSMKILGARRTSIIMNDTSTLAKIDPLYQPESQGIARTQLTTFIHYCEQQTGLRFADYTDFDIFSKSRYKIFWNLFLDWSQIVCQGDKQPVCAGDDCETAVFFPNLRLNYAEN